MNIDITYDEALMEEIAARFDLRAPNKLALATLVAKIAEGEAGQELIADLATGVGKTFLMSSLIEYLAQQGVRNVLVVTPGSTIQRKTLANFDRASSKYVPGADISPFIVTPENFQAANVGSVLRDPNRLKVFVFNIQQLISPTVKVSRRVRTADENLGDALYNHLKNASDLIVIADEHHIYRERAKAFSAAIRDLSPNALVGLTATPDKADLRKVVFQYTLGEAIADGHVKVPVIVYRQDGTKDQRTQLQDACQLLRRKQEAYEAYRQTLPEDLPVRPVLFVVCKTIEHASEVGQLLAQEGFIGDGSRVLEITSQSSDEALAELARVEEPDSRIRAIVSVNMLREGWDVKNIAVIAALRTLASQTLTEQILGRGLRLPFGKRTGVPTVDQVDLVAHDSYEQLLSQKDVLKQRMQLPSSAVDVDEHGAAVTADVDPGQPIDEDAASRLSAAGGEQSDSKLGVRGVGQQSLLEFGTAHDDPAQRRSAVAAPSLLLQRTEDRLELHAPALHSRTAGSPTVTFPRRERQLDHASFSLVTVSEHEARALGARFGQEVHTYISRDALDARRGAGGEVEIVRTPQESEEAGQPLRGLDVVQEQLIAAIMQQPEVPAERASRNGAKRLVRAFLEGASSAGEDTAEWGALRLDFAVEGMRRLIREKITSQPRTASYRFVSVPLPVEPVLASDDAIDAYNSQHFIKGAPYKGWQRSIMPIATFDAMSTEWRLAHLMDRSPDIAWWLRLQISDGVYIPTTEAGRYHPDFIAIDNRGTHWLIEGKADSDAEDASVVHKRAGAEEWARAVADEGIYGDWRYLFATESDIKQAGGSWQNLTMITET